MRNICCLNQISHYGTDRLTGDYKLVDDIKDAEGILVRSASLHETEFPAGLEAVARAGAGVNNIPLDECAKKGIVVFNTPGANKNGVKELVLAGLFLTSRDVVGGIGWCREHAGEEDIAKKMEKSKKASSVSVRSAVRSQTLPRLSEWKFTGMTRLSPSTPHGCCLAP